MPLVTTKDMFAKAYEGGYAIGAFNINNMETIQGIVEAGKLEKAPLILQVSSSAIKYANPIYLTKMVQAAVEDSGLPICLHLDHGSSYDLCVDVIKAGFTSVMIDASSHPLAENIKITSQVVKYAHDHGDVVEAELGRLAGVEDNVKVSESDALYTDPELLIFDEATSALDNETEAAIMESVNSLHGKKTMIIIAHRLTTIKECDIIYRVENGKITETHLEE